MSDQPTTYVPSAEKLASLGYVHQPQQTATNCQGCDEYRKPFGPDDRIITVFQNGQVFLQQKPRHLAHMGMDYWQYRLPNETFFEQLLDAIGWLPPSYVPSQPEVAGLTVAQLLDWPAGIGGISNEDFLRVRGLLNAQGWDVLTREQQLIYLAGQQNILGELYAATHAQQKKLILQLQEQLSEAHRQLEEKSNEQPA